MEINKTERISSESKDDIYEVQEIVGMKKEGVSIPINISYFSFILMQLRVI